MTHNRNGLRILAALCVLMVSIGPKLHAASSLVWMDIRKLWGAEADGSNATVLIRSFGVAGSTEIENPWGATASETHVYWADPSRFGIRRSNLQGENVDQVRFISNGWASDVALWGSYIYWSNYANGTIERMNLDGFESSIVVSGLVNPSAIAIGNGLLIWADDGSGLIQSTSLPGNGSITLIAAGQHSPMGLDLTDEHVYWTDFLEDTITRADLDGTNIMTIVQTGANPWDIVVDNDRLVWTEARQVVQSNLDGSEVEVIVPASAGILSGRGLALVVPEPGVWSLVLAGGIVLLSRRSRAL